MTLAWALACTAEAPTPAPAKAATPAAEPADAASSDAPAKAQENPRRPTIVAAPAGEVAPIVAEAVVAAAAEGKRLVVYVGAAWCEPCTAFHDAVVAGELDEPLADVRFLEFDMDHDKDRLEAAGYRSRYIPLFVIPQLDGRASERGFEGGVKGPRSVEVTAQRLSGLLRQA
ncbi:MAG: thioredoxin family protein [Myxococcales bacterium]|nr:thioredoxin family protein [Myxococcales bacterium]